MLYKLIYATPVLNAYTYGAQPGHCLVLEWHGQLTLLAVQQASVGLLHSQALGSYRQLLVCLSEVEGLGEGVQAWLACTLLPGIGLVGIERLAWVHGRALQQLHVSRQLQRYISPATEVCLFGDVEHAAGWLQAPLPRRAAWVPPARLLARRHRAERALSWLVLKQLARHAQAVYGLD